MSGNRGRIAAAEALGTLLLVAAVVGSGIMADRLTEDAALALLCNAIATGAALVVIVATLGPVSGAQLNPAVTLVLLLRREIAAGAAALCVAAQVAGGLAGTVLAHLMFGLAPFAAGTLARTGPGLWLAEAVAAFLLVLVILGGRAHRPEAVPVLVGLTITGAYWFTASTSFANPAVALARAATDSFAGIRPGDVPAFVLAEIAGALAAAALAGWLFGRPGR